MLSALASQTGASITRQATLLRVLGQAAATAIIKSRAEFLTFLLRACSLCLLLCSCCCSWASCCCSWLSLTADCASLSAEASDAACALLTCKAISSTTAQQEGGRRMACLAVLNCAAQHTGSNKHIAPPHDGRGRSSPLDTPPPSYHSITIT